MELIMFMFLIWLNNKMIHISYQQGSIITKKPVNQQLNIV